MHAVFDDGRIVAGAGAYGLELTLPGGPARCAGVTVVGVLPSHRRRGLLRRMMEIQLRDVREREEPIAALWASEETIYGRFGYGLASLCMNLKARRRNVRIRPELPSEGSVRLIETDEALRALPGLYDRILQHVERPLLMAALAATRGNQIRAAALLGLNRNTLRKKIKAHGIKC